MEKDTIAAIATASGNAGIAIVRISGPKSLAILKSIFWTKSKRPKEFKSHKVYYGKVLDKKKNVLDEVLVTYFKSPKSYTKEDLAEIHCHGGYVTAQRVLETILEGGARMAVPGEFTKRAFLNRRIDLTQAEAVADIIYAKSEKAQKIAEEQLRGSLKREVKVILKLVLDIYAQALANIDFPDEDIPEITKSQIAQKVKNPISKIEEILKNAKLGTIYKEGLRVAIVGLPNVGKSSLLNALVKDSRAIVTEVPGTTRDTLEEQIEINGLLVRLFDTAGITKTEDKVEKEGVLRSQKAIKEADILLLVVEKFNEIEKFLKLIRPQIKAGLRNKKTLLIRNKIDLKKNPGILLNPYGFEVIEILESSTKAGKGIKNIEKVLFNQIKEEPQEGNALLTNLRHKKLFESALRGLKKVHKLAVKDEAEEKILIEFDGAVKSLNEIIGENVDRDVLDKIFSRFCVGK